MQTAWFRHRSAFVLSCFFPWITFLPLSPPPATEPPAVTVEARVAGEPKTTPLALEEPQVLPGVVIEDIPKDSALEKGGLRVGDVILSWERLPNPPANPVAASGKIESPFDWMWLEIEQAPRGVVRLMAERKGTPFSCEIFPGPWGAEATPNFTPLPASWFHRGRLLEAGGELSSAITEWSSLAFWLSQREHAREEEAWLNSKLAQILAAQGSRAEAKSRYLHAIEKAPDPLARSLILDIAARFFFENGELPESENYFREALALRKTKSLGELGIARNMSKIGTVLYHRGRKSEVDSYLHTAYEVYNRLAPQTPEIIRILSNLGIRAKELGNLNQSIRYQQRSAAIAETIWPKSTVLADTLHELGTIERDSGRMQEARAHLTQALELLERLKPGSAQLANTLNALSLLYRTQGDLDQALTLARRSISISEKLTGKEGHTAAALNSIALIENALGQWPEAGADLTRALELASKNGQAKYLIPALLANMAVVQENQGNFSAALPLYRKALDLKRHNGLIAEIAPTLRSVGILHYRMGKPEQARAYLTEALSIQQKVQPGGIEIADTLDALGSVLAEGGNLAAARKYLEKALKIVKAGAPNSLVAANVYSNYGIVQQRLGSLSVARQYLQQAVEVYDDLFLRASYSHSALSSFSARHYATYINAAEVYVALGKGKSALEVSERAKGRSLMMQLTERDVLPLLGIPDQAVEKMRSLEKLINKIDIRHIDPSNHGRSTDESREQSERRSLFRERERLMADTRRSSPRLATLRYPLALSANEIRRVLDPGTVLVSLLVGGTHSYLFIVSRDDDLRVQAVPIGESELRQRVEKFRGLIAEAQGTTLGEFRAAELHRLSKELYNLLIAPAADRIEKAERVLIIADGPLHYLPFAALLREASSGDERPHDQYLAEWKPFHSVLSATVYAEIKKDRPGPTQAQVGSPLLLSAFGDPKFPAGLEAKAPEQIADIRVRSAIRRGTLQFESLPSSRREVEGIASLFPSDKVAIFLGAEATEERAKAIGKGARILHFATHARLDDRFPLNSALVLTIPEGFPEDRDNGLLQVWEIFEKVRLNADLVVLSACDTGLGVEQGGEGLIGLTRAFQYAGARSVIASLWSVRDQATSELMIRFYKHLRAGLPKDEALRQAQVELIRSPIEVVNEKGEKNLFDASAPYFWAGFQVYGDWQ